MKRNLCIILMFALIHQGFSQGFPKRLYTTHRIENPPVIDGNLNDEAWIQGEWQGDFTQFEPYEGRSPSKPTEFNILFDDLHLYVGMKCYDHPDSIAVRMTRRDNDDGDMVMVLFDSYHDLRTGFVFGVTAAGVRLDVLMSNDGANEDPSWDPIWQAKTKIHDWGWAVEMKIPFTQLRFKKNSSAVWGLEVARMIYRYNETNLWQPISRTSSGIVHASGELTGLQEITPRKQLDVVPYGVAGYHTSEPEPGNPFATGKEFRYNAGLDAKVGLTNNLTLDLTINPDFGQVEADPSEVNLTAFETYFQEKRPFFIEGNNITSFNVGLGDGDAGNDNLFYSRRIGRRPHGYPDLEGGEYARVPNFTNILGAAKITGKTEKGLSVGILESVTAEVKAEIDQDGERRSEVVEPLTNYSLVRLQKDLDQGNTIIGGMITSTNRKLNGTGIDMLHSGAYSGGIDFTQYFHEKSYRLSTSLIMSHVTGPEEAIAATQRSSARYFQRPDADHVVYDPTRTSLTGHGGKLEFGKISGNFNFLFMNIWKSPGLELNDMGFMREADFILNVLWGGYHFTEPFSIFRSLSLNSDVVSAFDFGGNLTGLAYEGNMHADFLNHWDFGVGGGYNFFHLSNTLLRGGPSMLLPADGRLWYYLSTDQRKRFHISFSGNLNRGTENYTRRDGYSVSLTLRPLNSMTVSLEPSYMKSMNELQYLQTLDLNGEESYLFARVNQKIFSMSLRVNYSILPDLSVQYWGQPFSGDIRFSEFKIITDPKAPEYSGRFHVYEEGTEISYADGDYYVDNGEYSFDFSNPDFKSNEWLSNLVVRWEFLPGSTAYLVWSQTRNYMGGPGSFSLGENLDQLFTNEKADNIFMIKFSYRIGLR
ncbi:MAG: DUF5916 domain-containing protein [Bacteroidales bacterium]